MSAAFWGKLLAVGSVGAVAAYQANIVLSPDSSPHSFQFDAAKASQEVAENVWGLMTAQYPWVYRTPVPRPPMKEGGGVYGHMNQNYPSVGF
uniref:Uncharacterized protein n=1 Tax=Chromera velia CCMP2878 TaxID=1169474 RepID=A0A0G4IG10_9ALVE|eukprot:Cvel_14081.t1-p1 / transcript=Cvel_14081.t1 / gene=Cvel_14081 / organism=Chromera_velia_CCMP2878 / gene_product=hypothetical protein / transcript_product=hypothetical protein / location=Cvel_scaffold989:255-802(+) / protein_length=91 / sequence_SO=supercontig / SO=protein_coding / is_pseudo=false